MLPVIIINFVKERLRDQNNKKRKNFTWKEMQGSPTSKGPASQIKSTPQVFKGNKCKIAKITKFYGSLFMI